MQGLIGQTLGRYKIIEHLGRGGMAEVYKAYQPSLDRHVAIKVMHSFLADDKGFLERFDREAKTVANLRHNNIVLVHDFAVENDIYYLVMEYIDGGTLRAKMDDLQERGEMMSLDESARIVRSVGLALKFAHEYGEGMVHRDVKPANVMIASDNRVILTDFGIAKIMSATNLTASGAMVGTPSYMSPEQGMGEPGDARSDIYSLGVMLYHLVVGQLPYDADTPLAVVLKHINEPLPMPRVIKPDVPEAIEYVVAKMLAKDKNERYQSVGEVLVDLRRAMSEADGATPSYGAVAMRIGDRAAQAGSTRDGLLQAATLARPGASQTVARSATAGTMPEVADQPAQRPRWLIPAIGIGAIALVGGVIAFASGRAASTLPTATPSITASETATIAVTPTPTVFSPPIGAFKEDGVDFRSGPGTRSQSLATVGTAVGSFTVRARSEDSQWLKIELQDGTEGWVPADAVDIGDFEISALPQGLILTTSTPTDTPAPTSTATPTASETPTVTLTPSPTLVPATRAPATATSIPPTSTPEAAAEALGWGFNFDFCTYDGDNYTCNVTIWGTGGDGNYHFAMENPDTGNWDEKTGGSATYLVRSRRCKIRTQQVRIWDESGDHIEPNLTTDPNVLASLMPGGSCTEP